MAIKTISVADAKKHLSEILARVASGGEGFVITHRGRPLARLVPLEPGGRHLADVVGWMPNEDPFFAELDETVANRVRHRPRASRTRRAKGPRQRDRLP